jgi:hypothetical protein
MNEPQIHNFNRFAPEATPISESPASASFQNPPRFEPYAYGIGIAQEESWSQNSRMDESRDRKTNEKSGHGTTSPYGMPEPTQTHPAYFAPIDHSALSPQFQEPQHASSEPLPYQPQSQFARPNRASTMKSEADEKGSQDYKAPLRSPTIPTSTSPRPYQQPIFSPGSLAGPNGINPDLHRPGQVAHPNMTFNSTVGGKEAWNHSMCECSGDISTCMTGVFCPCILDSRTAYRLNRRSEKLDSTDMLGFSSCNSRCGLMGVFGICGLCCKCSLPSLSSICLCWNYEADFYDRFSTTNATNANPSRV